MFNSVCTKFNIVLKVLSHVSWQLFSCINTEDDRVPKSCTHTLTCSVSNKSFMVQTSTRKSALETNTRSICPLTSHNIGRNKCLTEISTQHL